MAIQKRIILAAGHGGTDPGSVGSGTTEREECIRLVNSMASKLRKDKRISVVIVPHSLGLVDTINWVNARYGSINQGVVVEVHKNCCNAKGTETWYYGGSSTSHSLAKKFQTAMAGYMKTPNRGVKPDTANRFGRLGIVRDTNTWAILAEAGFIVGESLNTAKHSEALYRGALALWGLKPKVAPKPPKPPKPPQKPTTNKHVLAYRKAYVKTDNEEFFTEPGAEFVNLVTGKTIKTYSGGDKFTSFTTFAIGNQRYYTTAYSHGRILKENYLGLIRKEELTKSDSTPPTPPVVDDYPEEPKVDIKELEARVSKLENIFNAIKAFFQSLFGSKD
jgi:hypothetical protein